MDERPSIGIVAQDFGLYPEIQPLNPKFRPQATMLMLGLQITWSSVNPVGVLASIQRRLAAISPSFSQHRCGGGDVYHVHGLLDRDARASIPAAYQLEPGLALAHLVEHMIIDGVAHVTSEPRVSGVTGARRDSTNRFDIFVECPTRAVATLTVGLALSLTKRLLRGGDDTDRLQMVQDLAGHLYQKRAQRVDLELAAREIGAPSFEVRRAFRSLLHWGFACPRPFTMNFSGIPVYRVCAAGNRAQF